MSSNGDQEQAQEGNNDNNNAATESENKNKGKENSGGSPEPGSKSNADANAKRSPASENKNSNNNTTNNDKDAKDESPEDNKVEVNTEVDVSAVAGGIGLEAPGLDVGVDAACGCLESVIPVPVVSCFCTPFKMYRMKKKQDALIENINATNAALIANAQSMATAANVGVEAGGGGEVDVGEDGGADVNVEVSVEKDVTIGGKKGKGPDNKSNAGTGVKGETKKEK